jgi:hypothetical protein
MKYLSILAVLVSFAVCSSHAAISKWSTSFEEYPLGTPPAFDANQYPAGDMWLYNNALIVNTNARTGSQCLKLDNTHGNSVCFDVQNVAFTKSIIKFSFMNLVGSGVDFWVQVSGTATSEPTFAIMEIDQTSGIHCWTPGNTHDGTVLVPAVNVTSNVWHDVQVRADMTTGLVAIAYDGQVVGQNIPFYASGAWAAGSTNSLVRWFVTNGGSDSVLFDDVVIAKVDDAASPEYIAPDLNKDSKITLADLAVLGNNWLANSFSSVYFESIVTGNPNTSSLPGYYVASTKGINTSSQRFARLGMYTFNADGTVAEKYWNWIYNQADQSAVSDRTIGTGTSYWRVSPVADSTQNVVSLATFLTGESAMTTLTGTYTMNGYDLVINFSDGSWEKWYQTWEELNNLYKMELYDASYLQSGSLCWITKSGSTWIRNNSVQNADGTINIKNAGWMFGSNSRDFTYADTIASFWKDTNGSGLDYDQNAGQETLYKGGPRSPFNPYVVTDSTPSGSTYQWAYYWTNNNSVIRRAMRDIEDQGLMNYGNLFEYITTPASNPGIMARRMMYQRAHDLSANGNVVDDEGQLFAGLQIIDNAGHYRGAVMIQNSYNSASKSISGLFWIDNMSAAARTGIRDKAVYAQNFDFTPGSQEYINGFPGWVDNNYFWASWGDYGWSALGGSATTSTARYVSSPMSMNIDQYTTLTYQSEAEISGKCFFNYKLYMVGQGSTPVVDYPEFGWANRALTTQLYANFVYMGTDGIRDVDVVPGRFKGVVTSDTWHDIFWALDTAAQTTTLYVDGENRGTIPFYNGTANPAPGYTTKINRFQWACNNAFWTTPVRYVDDFYFGQYPRNCVDAAKMGINAVGDINGDCSVDFKDILIFVQDWLGCADSTTWNCIAK